MSDFLYRLLPKARVIYCSATGVSDVKNMVRLFMYCFIISFEYLRYVKIPFLIYSITALIDVDLNLRL